MYGVTECTLYQTFRLLHHSDDARKVGMPHDNTKLLLAHEPYNDPNKTVDERGTIGEIFIGGMQVGVGYFKDEKLTREHFLSSPSGEHFRVRGRRC